MKKLTKRFRVPTNFFKTFYLLLPILPLLRIILEERAFGEFMVILIFFSLVGDISLRLFGSKKQDGFFSIFSPTTKRNPLCAYFENLFWILLTCLIIISFFKAQIYTICFVLYGFAKSLSYIIGKQFKSTKFYDLHLSQSIAFYVIGLIVATFMAASYNISALALFFIYFCFAFSTLVNARKNLIKFNNPSLSIAIFVITLTIFDGLWKVF
jgi:hypothetical protein